MLTYWLLVLVLGLVTITVVTEKVRGSMELFVLLLASMLVVLQFLHLGLYRIGGRGKAKATAKAKCCGSGGSGGMEGFQDDTGGVGSAASTPSADAQVRKRNVDQGREDLSKIEDGMTVYVSSFSRRAFPDGGGKLWTNLGGIAQKRDRPSIHDRTGSKDDVDFHFSAAPSFTRRDGFKMLGNPVTGPYSFQLGIRADMSFSIIVLCQFTGDLPKDDEENKSASVLFRMFANTIGNNGVALSAFDGSGGDSRGIAQEEVRNNGGEGDATKTKNDADGSHHSSVQTLGLRLHFGQDIVVDCKTRDGPRIEVHRDHKYLLVITKHTDDRLTVRAIDVHTDMPHVILLADHRIDPLSASSKVDLSNKDMVLNERANWNGHLQAFGCYDRALSERDVITLFDHYTSIFEKFDPTYLRLMDTISDLSRFKDCPYDERTCNACKRDMEDGDWGNAQNLVTATETCRKAVGDFCKRNPRHPRCTCWSVNHPEYHSKCKKFRCLFGGTHECDDDDRDRTRTRERRLTSSTDGAEHPVVPVHVPTQRQLRPQLLPDTPIGSGALPVRDGAASTVTTATTLSFPPLPNDRLGVVRGGGIDPEVLLRLMDEEDKHDTATVDAVDTPRRNSFRNKNDPTSMATVNEDNRDDGGDKGDEGDEHGPPKLQLYDGYGHGSRDSRRRVQRPSSTVSPNGEPGPQLATGEYSDAEFKRLLSGTDVPGSEVGPGPRPNPDMGTGTDARIGGNYEYEFRGADDDEWERQRRQRDGDGQGGADGDTPVKNQSMLGKMFEWWNSTA